MSFLDKVQLPEEQKKKSSFLSSVVVPRNKERAAQIATMEKSTYDAKKEAEQAGSIGGLAKQTAKNILGIPKSIFDSFTSAADKFTPKTATPTTIGTPEEISLRQGLSNLDKITSEKSVIGPNTGLGLQKQPKTFEETLADIPVVGIPIRVGKAATTVYADTIQNAGDRIADLFEKTDPKKNYSLTEKVSSILSADLGLVNIAFSPVSAGLKSAEELPIVGPLAKFVNGFFGALGTIGESNARDLVNNLPISEEKKATIMPVAQELAALGMQMIAGTALHGSPKAKITELQEVLKKEVAEGYKEFKEGTPVEIPQTKPTIEPVKTDFLQPEGIKPITPKETAPTSIFETRTATAAEKVVADAVAKGIKEEFGSLPEYKTMNMADQALRANDLIKNNPELAKKIVNGEVNPPGDLRLGSVFSAMKVDAITKGDTKAILELAHSKATTLASQLGQEIKSFDAGLRNDPVKAIQDIEQTRNKGKEKSIAKSISKAKTEITKASPKIKDWEGFIKSLQC